MDIVNRYRLSLPDRVLAALAIGNGLTLASHDSGFRRFARLEWIDPLQP